MTTQWLRVSLAATASCCLAVVGIAGPAGAAPTGNTVRTSPTTSPAMPSAVAPTTARATAPSADLEAAKKALTARIDGRLQALDAMRTALDSAKQVTATHRTTLVNLVAGHRTGLQALRTKVAGETTAAALKADAEAMVADHRIFLLVQPQVRLTVAADLTAAAVEQLRKAADALDAAIATAKQAGKDTATAETDLADLRRELAAAESAAVTDGIDALLAAKLPADPAVLKAKVAPVREGIRTVRGHLRNARTEAQNVRKAIAN